MNNTIWLSGSRGFVGSYIKQSLLASGYRVISVSNSHPLSNDDSVKNYKKVEILGEFNKEEALKIIENGKKDYLEKFSN